MSLHVGSVFSGVKVYPKDRVLVSDILKSPMVLKSRICFISVNTRKYILELYSEKQILGYVLSLAHM